MRKFLKTQMVHSLSTTITDQEILQLIPKDDKDTMPTPLSKFTASDSDLISILELSHATLAAHSNYSDNRFIQLMEPRREAIFTDEEISQLFSFRGVSSIFILGFPSVRNYMNIYIISFDQMLTR